MNEHEWRGAMDEQQRELERVKREYNDLLVYTLNLRGLGLSDDLEDLRGRVGALSRQLSKANAELRQQLLDREAAVLAERNTESQRRREARQRQADEITKLARQLERATALGIKSEADREAATRALQGRDNAIRLLRGDVGARDETIRRLREEKGAGDAAMAELAKELEALRAAGDAGTLKAERDSWMRGCDNANRVAEKRLAEVNQLARELQGARAERDLLKSRTEGTEDELARLRGVDAKCARMQSDVDTLKAVEKEVGLLRRSIERLAQEQTERDGKEAKIRAEHPVLADLFSRFRR
jgi:hypothetical protein